MAKSEGRGFRKYLPSLPTIVKVFVALVIIKLVLPTLVTAVPGNVVKYVPNV